MRRFLGLSLSLAALASGAASAAGISGDYIEARTADVFTGPCFSNSEVFIAGNQAVIAWGVREGSFGGVDLSGLTVAAAVRGSSTFSKDEPSAARTVLMVDQAATPEQREALIAMARHLGGDRLQNIVDVRSTRMSMMVESGESQTPAAGHQLHPGMPQAPKASFWAAGLAEIVTRPLDDGDHLCGNESVAYEPLSEGVSVKPAYTMGHGFKGKGLDTIWSDNNRRSAFVGHFAY